MINPNNFPIGISDFTKLVQKECVLIDKTMLIKDIIDDKADVILITRPRRFGKTLNMSMLKAFFSVDGADVFKDLLISKETQFCASHQNKYRVIFLSFKDCKASSFEQIFIQIQNMFSKLYQEHDYLLTSPNLSQIQKEKCHNTINETVANPTHLSQCLYDLISCIHKHTGIKPIVLIDEYDTPIHSAYTNEFYDQIIEFMRGMLGSALKDNTDLEKAVITGITKVSQESMFSGLNNIQTYSMLNHEYGQYFGFTAQEVTSLLPEGGSIDTIKDWYNGYTIGHHQIYNPWSIINCLKKHMTFSPYWRNTSDNALVYELIGNGDEKLKIKFEKLIKGEPQAQILHDTLTFKNIQNNATAIWTLLLHAGYLNVVSSTRDDLGKINAFVAIPNKEVLSLYVDIVENWFCLNGDESVYRDFIDSLEHNNPGKFITHIQDYMASSCSYFDLNSKTPEHVFHIFMMGLLVGFRGRYDVTSNKEAGHGRYDVFMTPKDPNHKGILMEFKVCADVSKLEDTAQAALAQITNKQYTDGFKGEILAIGMAFCGKQMIGVHKVL